MFVHISINREYLPFRKAVVNVPPENEVQDIFIQAIRNPNKLVYGFIEYIPDKNYEDNRLLREYACFKVLLNFTTVEKVALVKSFLKTLFREDYTTADQLFSYKDSALANIPRMVATATKI